MQLLTRTDEMLGSLVEPDANRALCAAPREELEKGRTPPDEMFYGSGWLQGSHVPSIRA